MPWDAMTSADRTSPLLVASDNGHDLKLVLARSSKTSRFRRLIEDREAPIVFLVSAPDVHWNAVRVRDREWGRRVVVTDPLVVSGLSLEDASALVAAMENAHDPEAALGGLIALETSDMRAAALMQSAAERQRNSQRASLFGALLEMRTGTNLEAHVERLMERLDGETSESGHSLLRLYLHVGALQFHGLGAVDRDTLAQAADIRVDAVESLIGRTLPPEISIRFESSGWWFRIRHDAIARTVFEVATANESYRAELAEVTLQTVRAVVALWPEGWRDRRLSKIFYLSQHLLNGGWNDLAIHAAQGAATGSPGNLFLLTSLASTLRKAGPDRDGALAGAALLERAAASPDNWLHETRDGARSLYREWAACIGLAEFSVSGCCREFVPGRLLAFR